MIENYKGWEITLNWDNKAYLDMDSTKTKFFNQKEKWIGVNLNGKKIFNLLCMQTRIINNMPNFF